VCPDHTTSVAGSSSQLGCRCLPGYVCSYTKRITAIVTLNASSVADFNNDVNGIKTNFLNSLSRATGVSVDKISITQVVVHGTSVASSGGRRRLLSSSSSHHHGLIDVFTKVDDARYIKDLRHHIHRDLFVKHVWLEAHRVHASSSSSF
jgi:hypothetical protein